MIHFGFVVNTHAVCINNSILIVAYLSTYSYILCSKGILCQEDANHFIEVTFYSSHLIIAAKKTWTIGGWIIEVPLYVPSWEIRTWTPSHTIPGVTGWLNGLLHLEKDTAEASYPVWNAMGPSPTVPAMFWAYLNMPHDSTCEKPSFLLFGLDSYSPLEASLLPGIIGNSTWMYHPQQGKLPLGVFEKPSGRRYKRIRTFSRRCLVTAV